MAGGEQETDNPDLRDRAYVYWRLLSTDPEAAKEVVLAEKPIITDSGSGMEPALLATLLSNLSSLASVYHKPPEVGACRGWEATRGVSCQEKEAGVGLCGRAGHGVAWPAG